MRKRELDIVVLSDVHLGTYGCHAKELLHYLRSIQTETLILNGDFVDMWQFRKRYFPKEHIQVIQCILKMASQGTKIYYITGNHDDALRRYSDFSSGNIHLRDKLVFRLQGKSYWVFHGDVFDVVVNYSPFIARIGGKGYDWLILLNRLVNKMRHLLGLPRMSFASKVKYRVKEAVKYVSDFEYTAIRQAARQKYDYVICGHIHRPRMRTLKVDGREVTYLNAGDWVENLTALEYKWDRWSVHEYGGMDHETLTPQPAVKQNYEDIPDSTASQMPEGLLDYLLRINTLI